MGRRLCRAQGRRLRGLAGGCQAGTGQRRRSLFAYRNGYAAYAWVTAPTGRRQRKYVYGKTRVVVHAKWLELQRLAGQGPVATRLPTLDQYLNYWRGEVVRPNLAPATATSYDMFVRHYIKPDLGARRLDKLTVRDVQSWLGQLRTRCIALSNAVREEVLTRNVAALVRVPKSRPRKEKAWSVEEARRFLESARADDDPLYAGYVLILVLGMRRGEALGLGWAEVDLDARELRVVWQLQRVGGQLLRRQTKTEASEAPLPLPEICTAALRERRERQDEWRDVAGSAWHDSGLVLSTRLGLPVEPRNFHAGLQGPLRQGRCPPGLGALHPAHLRVTSGRPRRPPASGHAGPAAQPDLPHDERLQRGQLAGDQGGAQAARQRAAGNLAAVLCCCTSARRRSFPTRMCL